MIYTHHRIYSAIKRTKSWYLNMDRPEVHYIKSEQIYNLSCTCNVKMFSIDPRRALVLEVNRGLVKGFEIIGVYCMVG